MMMYLSCYYSRKQNKFEQQLTFSVRFQVSKASLSCLLKALMVLFAAMSLRRSQILLWVLHFCPVLYMNIFTRLSCGPGRITNSCNLFKVLESDFESNLFDSYTSGSFSAQYTNVNTFFCCFYIRFSSHFG